MRGLLHKFSVGLLFLYIVSVYVFSYNKDLNIISQVLFITFVGSSLLFICLRGSVLVPKCLYFLFAFYMLMVASYYWIIEDTGVTQRNLTMIVLIAIVVVITNIIINEDQVYLLLKMLFFAGIVMCVYSLAIYGVEGTLEAFSVESELRLGKEINQENTFGVICAISASLGFYFAYHKKEGLFYLISIIPLIFALSSGSRKVVLILIASAMILVGTKKGKSKISTFFLYFFSIIILGIVINYLMSLDMNILRRFESFLNVFKDGGVNADSSALTRLGMIKNGVKWFLEKPILGHGINQYSVLYSMQHGVFTYSHSNIIEILVNHGIVGFVFYYGIYVYMLISIIRAVKRNVDNAVAILICYVYLLIMNVFSVVLYEKPIYIILGTIISYIIVNKDKLKKMPFYEDEENEQ